VAYTTQRFNLDLKEIGRVLPFYYPFAHFPLLFSLVENQESFDLVIEYDVELFDSKTVQSYAQSFVYLCKQALMGEEIKINSLSLLSDEERLSIINRFNPFNKVADQLIIKEKLRFDDEDTLVSRFRKVAKINPNRIAVQSFNQKISYKDLDELTDRIAYTLCQEGVVRGNSVTVLTEREVDYVVAILSILKVGAVYVPLDPDYPIARLETMIETAQSNLCLNLQSKIISLSVPMLAWSEILRKAQFNNDFQTHTQIDIDATSRAYVMFTSGSTGKPKGVGISHRNILRLVEPNNIIPLNENTKTLLTGSPSFDATTYEVWAPLLNGGTVALIDKMTLLDSRLLKEAIAHFETNTMWLTAPLFARMVYENPRLFQGMSYLIVGGDVVSPEAVRLVQETTPEVIVVNGYGPTENTTFSTFYLIPQGVDSGVIPIGRPLVKSTAYVMDRGGNLLPPTALGELYVGGEGVSEGYVNDPLNLSSQKFMEYQWPDRKIEYLYRTGDLAYWDSNGLIHLLGRSDSQVKVRGFRVELNEVQDLLVRHPDIQDAYVTLAKEQEVEGLAAYVILKNPVNMDEILISLQDSLPSYMVPTFYLEVDSLPLNINGKISKEQLPKGLKVLRRMSQQQLACVLTEVEREISCIWSELLGIESPGLDDLFFRIGGDSMKVVTLASRLGKLYGVLPSIVSLYSLNTIRKQAEHFSGLKSEETKNSGVSISQPNSQQSDLTCRVKASEVQKRLFVLDQITSGRAPYLIPILFKLNGKLNLNRIKDAWLALRQRHHFLRSQFLMDPDQSILWIELQSEDSPETFSVFEGIQESQLSEWLENRLNSFTLADCGVARLDILETDKDRFYLAFTFHHIDLATI
jgi:amino acid adenylation domain-containing protein